VYPREVRGVLVDLKDDAEGWVPLEVEYQPASAGVAADWEVIERHPELASASLHVALQRGARLAVRLHVTHILHYF
jgi:hypothetical protein